ncbi:uncharacterized protein LOC103927125 isoform X1 [Pyrus x bretschneideri]|uniref:uncharacterized protein LOC103927125 isoform X1 n=2 Tax=Pyrus x bretschneideri TaxID=225117 RepID=UPI0020304965|nr:uncharacterized protein LOC103927125 isoform X1 [Pyrus x bretschneideri]XP_048432042.1 uncharacterized protein LOC103927125 isoform X1 [Pyrus x bretschneideri]
MCTLTSPQRGCSGQHHRQPLTAMAILASQITPPRHSARHLFLQTLSHFFASRSTDVLHHRHPISRTSARFPVLRSRNDSGKETHFRGEPWPSSHIHAIFSINADLALALNGETHCKDSQCYKADSTRRHDICHILIYESCDVWHP